MARGGRGNGFPYWIGFFLATATLAGMTILLVLVVLPQRFALQADLRESGVSFPTVSPAFEVPPSGPLVEPAPSPAPPQPGPAEVLWRDLRPLLDAGMYAMAVERMDDYLLEYPQDPGVRRERARTLVRLGRGGEAYSAFSGLARDPGTREDLLALARFLRDAGDIDGAARAYRALIASSPGDAGAWLELGQAYLWSGRYDDAMHALEEALRLDPSNDGIRLDLARATWVAKGAAPARAVLAAIGYRSPYVWQAVGLDLQIASSFVPYEAPVVPDFSPLARARRAAARGDREAADRWYRTAIDEDPARRETWLEWIDYLQLRAEDPGAARDALAAYAARFGVSGEERLRLARLRMWTGQERRAEADVDSLLASQPDDARAWALKADLLRWRGDRVAAGRAYRRALEIDPLQPEALEGRRRLDEASAAVVERSEPRGVGPLLDFMGDSDEFQRFDAALDGGWTGGLWALRGSAGYRWLEGLSLDGSPAADGGAFADIGVARWWREATVRTGVRAGVQHLDGFDTELTLGADVRLPDAGGWDLLASWDHGPSYPYTWTYESVEAGIRTDVILLSAFRVLGTDWTLGGSMNGAIYEQPGDDNSRLGGRLALGRRLTRLWRAELATSALGFSDPAPVADRSLYWDPSLYWATTLSVGIDYFPPDAWGGQALLTGGTAWIDERAPSGGSWVPQFGVQGGVARSWGAGEMALTGFYRRGRERDYSAWGASLELRLRGTR